MKIISLLSVMFLSMLACSAEQVSNGETNPTETIPDKDNTSQIYQDSTKAIYRQFAFVGTHNSYSGNLDGMAREGIKTQLNSGLRFFEFDLFSYHTDKILETTESDVVSDWVVFNDLEKPQMLKYSSESGLLHISEIVNGEYVNKYSNKESPLLTGDRDFQVLFFKEQNFIFNYHRETNTLTISKYDNNTITNVFASSIKGDNLKLFPFVFNNKMYLSIQGLDDLTYKIQEVSFASDVVEFGKTVFENSFTNTAMNITPFQQNGNLYLFKHSDQYVTNYTVETLNTHKAIWEVGQNVKRNSNKLNGTIRCAYFNEKLFVNTYTANGSFSGYQLVMDNHLPNLVNECHNEISVLSGAKQNVYPTKGGYFLHLKNDSKLQVLKINIGNPILGHDAPGDEVDLSVDNPNSIKLEDWLSYIANWSDSNVLHEPLFIMTELKNYEQWIADVKWQSIILLMQEKFGNKLRYHNSLGFQKESIVDNSKIVDGETLYFMDKNGSKDGGLLGKVILYIQPNNNITKSAYTNDYFPFNTTDGLLQNNFIQLKNYRVNNKLVSPDWRNPSHYGGNIGEYIDNSDNSYISRIFHMQDSRGDSQYNNIKCSNVMFAVSDRPYDNGLFKEYITTQKFKNKLIKLADCDE